MNSKFFKRLVIFFLVFLAGITGGLVSTLLITNKIDVKTATTSSSTVNNLTVNQTDTKTATTEAVKIIQNAVVSVVNYQTSTGNSDYTNFFNSNLSNQEDELVVYGEGSGAIYKKEGDFAYVVTNTHVVEGAEKLEILLADGTRLDGELIGSDTYSDLAVIKIEGQGIETIGEFADSSTLTLGEPAIAIGSPLGSQYANSVTAGIVSGLSRTVTLTNEQGETISTNAIQTDAAINEGNSGGPLINIQGQIIGINSSKITYSRTQVAVEGMGFAIPSNDVIAIISQLETNGKVIRPAIGISMVALAEVSSVVYEDLNLPDEVISGIIVADVQEGMPADGKLQQYDVIVAINDQDIASGSDLQSVLYKHQLGDTITVTFYRQQEKLTRDIVLNKTNQELVAPR